jgi:SAM-dependent methyltransferase
MLSHPEHFDYYNLFDYLNYDNWTYTIKMDGIRLYHSINKINDKNSINHSTNKSFNYIIDEVLKSYPNNDYIDMEYLIDYNKIFIFDIISKNNRNVVYADCTINELIDNYHKIIFFKDMQIFLKPYFKIENDKKIETLKMLLGLLTNDKLNVFADGFILTNFEKNINIKLKPLNKMSIDLKLIDCQLYDSNNVSYNIISKKELSDFENNKIYQIININDKWIINRIRPDKAKPNSNLIVNNIIQIIKYWSKLIDYINSNDIHINKSNKYYEAMDSSNKIFRNNHMKVTDKWLQTVKNLNIQINGILDIGCGSGYLTIDNFSTINWLGIDIDHKKIKQIHQKYCANPNIKYIIGDCNNIDNNLFFDIDYNLYDTLFMIHSSHYIQSEQFKIFIKKFVNIKNIIIVYIEPEYIKSISNDSNQFIHPKNGKIWQEPLFDLNFWLDTFKNHKMTKYDFNNVINNVWFENHKLAIFRLL